jgi:PadR family transcriptional regulator PadR
MLILSIWKLQDDAYSLTIRRHLKKITRKNWSFGSLFNSLEGLVKKKYIVSYIGDTAPAREGRRKRLYKVTKEGLEAIVEIKKIDQKIWEDIPNIDSALGPGIIFHSW